MGEPALSISYRCTVDGFIPLGLWTKIEGLGYEYEVNEFREGGVNTHMQKVIGPMKYTNVRLTRPVDADSRLVALWLGANMVKVVPQTMAIVAMDSAGNEVATWNLSGVVPLKWSGPSLDILGNQVATETLELVYDGIFGFGEAGGAIAAAMTISATF